MVKRYEVTDKQWQKIEGIVPGKPGDRGRTGADNRRFVNGCLWVLRSGAFWHHLPPEYGAWKTAHKRFTRWARSGVWENVFKVLLSDPKNAYVSIDTTIVRVHQQAAAGKGGIKTRLWGVPEAV